jgi:hypothetical protein
MAEPLQELPNDRSRGALSQALEDKINATILEENSGLLHVIRLVASMQWLFDEAEGRECWIHEIAKIAPCS